MSYPSFITFEPTNYCNLKCPDCPTGSGILKRPKGFANIELFKKIVSENKKYLFNILLYFQGEPLLHKQIGEMIQLAKNNKIFTILSTNANTLPDCFESLKNSLPDKIIISMDGISEKTYLQYRKSGNFNKVIKSLELLSNIKSKQRPIIEVQFLVFKHNENEIPKLKSFLSKFNIDKISLKSVQIYDYKRIENLPQNQKYSRYTIANEKVKIKHTLKNNCKRIIFGSVITWDGKLIPCCFDKDTDFFMGNINLEKINEVRNSKNYSNFVKTIFKDRCSITMCENCTEGLTNIKFKI